MPASYDMSLTDVEADSDGTTEAGTTQRDVVREAGGGHFLWEPVGGGVHVEGILING